MSSHISLNVHVEEYVPPDFKLFCVKLFVRAGSTCHVQWIQSVFEFCGLAGFSCRFVCMPKKTKILNITLSKIKTEEQL